MLRRFVFKEIGIKLIKTVSFRTVFLCCFSFILIPSKEKRRKLSMKIIETGTTYKIYGEDLIVLENLPAQNY